MADRPTRISDRSNAPPRAKVENWGEASLGEAFGFETRGIAMSKLRGIAFAAMILVGAAIDCSECQAGGRRYTGGHPYHNGYYYIPPSSAYESVRVFPPPRYGVPAYYVPASYMPPGALRATMPTYPGTPMYRAAGYYMSAYGYYHTYDW